jgi:deoxyribonuclease (pyrimidine dimer)
MVRINLINPKALADQHLIAEYNEILMLFGHVKKYPKVPKAPVQYRLGPGHINFFKTKLRYLKKRHELLKSEMRRRGFVPEKTIMLSKYPRALQNDWNQQPRDVVIIKERIIQKLKAKPDWYRYEGKSNSLEFFINLLEQTL